jgi:hypothetical protein
MRRDETAGETCDRKRGVVRRPCHNGVLRLMLSRQGSVSLQHGSSKKHIDQKFRFLPELADCGPLTLLLDWSDLVPDEFDMTG